RRGLAPVLTGRELARVDIRDGRLTAPLDPLAVALELAGSRVVDVGRRGKYLTLRLEDGRLLVVHLRMTGWLYHLPAREPPPELAFLRATFDLDDGARLLYSDTRRFGTMRLLHAGDEEAFWRTRVGPEPLEPAWTPAVLRRALRGRRAAIKALLLHQVVVAG